MRKRIALKTTLTIVLPSTMGYFTGCYAAGAQGYCPSRTPEWVKNQLDNAALCDKSEESLCKVGYYKDINLSSFHSLTFRDPKSLTSTKTFVHCGPFSVGFPFLVHGGLLATLLKSSAELALDDFHGNLVVRYLNPTFVDQILRIESHKNKEDLQLLIYSAKNECLVKANVTLTA